MAVGLFCMMMSLMVVFAGVAGVIVLLCTRGGRKALATLGLLVLAFCVAIGVLRVRSAYTEAMSRQQAATLEQETVADRVKAEIEARLGGDASDEFGEPISDHVTLELRWHADKLRELASSPGAIAAAVTSILATVDDAANEKADLAGVPLKSLLELPISFDEGHRVPLGEIAQVKRRRVVGVERPEDTIHIRLEGVKPDQMEALLSQASSLIERAVASADDPLRSLVNIDRDKDAHGISIRIPAREVRQVAASLMLPAGLDTPPIELAQNEDKSGDAKIPQVQEVAAEAALETEKPLTREVAVPAVSSEPKIAPHEAASGAPSATVRTKPDWVDQGEVRLPNGIYRMTARSGPYSSTEECFAEAPGMVYGIVTRYVGRLFGREAQDQLKVPGGWIESVLVKDQWIGEIESETLGTTMYEMHVLVEFDDVSRRELAGMWHREQIDRRLARTGAASGLVLLLLGTTFGYLKLDTATRGFYSGRLKLAAGAIVAGGGIMLIQMMRMV